MDLSGRWTIGIERYWSMWTYCLDSEFVHKLGSYRVGFRKWCFGHPRPLLIVLSEMVRVRRRSQWAALNPW